jgi:hypothetical protein
LFSASRDRTVRVWDRDTGHELHAFAWASDGTWSFALSHDGRLALAGNEDGSMNFLDFSYTERHRDLETRLSAALTGLRATPGDGQALVVVGEWYAFRGLSTWALELFRRAERAGAKVSSLVLARCHWREGDLSAARREFQRAKARGEAPADYLDFLVAQLGSSDQAERLSQLSLTDGRMRYPFIGIRSVTSAGGAKVTRVFPDSPAAAAGLVIDDVIVRADDVDVDNDRELGNFLASRSTGSVIALRYQRAGQTHSTQVKLAERPVRAPGDLRDLVRDPKTGWLLQTLTPELAASLGLPLDMRGAVMVEPPPNAMVLAIRIQRDEVLVRVQGEAVLTAEDAVAKLARVNLADWEHLKTVRPGTVR